MKEFRLPKIFNWELAHKPIAERPYKVYTALLNTQDISNPIVLENTLGSDILWTIGGGLLQ